MKRSQEFKDRMSLYWKGKRKGANNPNWKGGGIIVDGYRYVFKPTHPNSTKDGYICEHRLIMEAKIGRFLERKEAVHHLNHDRLDNRIDNLHLCPSNGKHFIENHLISRDKYGRFYKVQKSI